MKVLDLFSGIGGFSLGLERAGMQTVAFCEIDPFCRQVLAKHWPGVRRYEDIRELTAARLQEDGISVDLICGGFPCQDISVANKKGKGIAGERSGLWSEYARLIGELRPKYAIMENVTALLGRGLGKVLGDLAEIRYDAEWHCIPASAVGAPHRRDRLWIIAYPNGIRWNCLVKNESLRRTDFNRKSFDAWRHEAPDLFLRLDGFFSNPSVGVHRNDDGVPHSLDRLKALGNAVVPPLVEVIGMAIMGAEAKEASVA